MVLADPGLVKAELVEPFDQVEVALEALGRVLFVRMERRQKDAVPKVDLAHRRLAFAAGAMLSGLLRARNSATGSAGKLNCIIPSSREGRDPPMRARDN
jgi:hypothetical protein